MALIDIKSLVAFDMTCNNRWIIWVEMVVGCLGAFALAALIDPAPLWWWCLLGLGCNYLFPAGYATWFMWSDEHTALGRSVVSAGITRRYNLQQWPLLLIPFLAFVIALWQSTQRLIR